MQTVVTAFQVLEVVASRQPIGVSELAREIKRPKSTTHRFLRALEDAGWVRATGGERSAWVLTARAAIVARAVGRDSGLREVARPVLERLRDDTGEASHLALAEKHEIVIIERVECLHSVRVYEEPGQHGPSHATAAGKVLLAFSTEGHSQIQLPARLFALTDHTITNRKDFESELALVRQQGWASAIDEGQPDVGAIAAPVFDSGSEPIAAIGVFFPLNRLPEDRGDAYGRLVLRGAEEITKALS
jgi:DNA-binding IclR family transcriptional regulator